MGIAEYWLYAPEGHAPPAYADGVSFGGWRLDDTGSYVRIPRQLGKGEWAVYHSAVLAADIRMLPTAARDMDVGMPDETESRHWLQWWDPDQGLWRDREVAAERKTQAVQAEAERKTQEALLNERIVGMHSLLKTKLSDASLAQIEANWRRAGQGRTMEEVVEVWLGKADWHSLQFPDQPDSQGSK